jgi:hypothetical protein
MGGCGVSSHGMVGEWFVDTQDSKVVALACVDYGPFVVEP